MDFSEIYEANYKKIFNYILYNIGNVEIALDITSETFFKALNAWPRFENNGASPTTWLYKIASREIASFYRKSKRTSNTLELKYLQEAHSSRQAIDSNAIYEAQEHIDNLDDFLTLSSIIRELPLRYRQVVYLRFYLGMSISEISDLLKKPSGTIKSQIKRALKKLKDEMQPF